MGRLAGLLLEAAILLPAAGEELRHPPMVALPPVIDGRLDEPEWSSALAVTDFLQRLPQEGTEPSERTLVLMLYTPTDLFIGVRAYDSRAGGLTATVLRRDNFDVVQNDQFAVAIDSYDDGRNGYWFSTNPLGVRVDAQFFEESDVWIGEWNGVWDCASRMDGEGWTSEIRIPFSTLRFRAAAQNVMGINLFRRIVRTNEQLFAPLIPLKFAYGTPNVSIARKYVFAGISGGRDIRFRPYLLGRQDWAGRDPALPDRVGEALKVGLDGTFGLTPSLAASLTLNTDFALTELDDRQINLTRFDLFYPERRDFFLENGGLFQFGLPGEVDLLFSRRIGLSEQSDGELVEVPVQFGGKLTGRAGPFEVGLLDVRTRADGEAPPENFLTARVKYGFGLRSYVGGIVTQKLLGGRFENAALGADATTYIAHGVGVSSFVAATRSRGAEPSGGDWQPAWNVTVFRRGEQEAFRLALSDVGAHFDPQMGFLLRSGVRKLDGEVVIPWYAQTRLMRRLAGSYAASHVQRHGGGTESWSHTAAVKLDFQSDDTFRLYGGPFLDHVRDSFTVFRDRVVPPGVYRASLVGVALVLKSGRRLGGEASAEAAGFYGGTRRTLIAHVQLKASRWVTAGAQYSSSWVDLATAAPFRAEVAQARLDAAWDTHLSGRALLQYDNSSRDLSLNLRLNYLLREGTEVAFVYGRRENGQGPGATLGGPAPADNVALVRLTWLISL